MPLLHKSRLVAIRKSTKRPLEICCSTVLYLQRDRAQNESGNQASSPERTQSPEPTLSSLRRYSLYPRRETNYGKKSLFNLTTITIGAGTPQGVAETADKQLCRDSNIT